jgi:hypothetical protein
MCTNCTPKLKTSGGSRAKRNKASIEKPTYPKKIHLSKKPKKNVKPPKGSPTKNK